MRTLKEEEIKEIIKLYIDNKISINNLKRKFRLQHGDVRQLLIENGINPRTHRESRLTYLYNEDYFSEIDTEDKAYWLGFIFADGFITKRTNGNPVFGITLAEKEPLELLNKCMNSNKPIKQYKKVNSYSSKSIEYKLAFCSAKLVSDLEKQGCIERKTFKLKFPNIKKELIPHFIRGYFDGDGSVFLHTQKVNNREYQYIGVTICGIYSFLDELTNYTGYKSCIYKDKRKETDCWSLKLLSNIRALQFYHYIYNNAHFFLNRKRKKFEDFIKDKGSTTIIGNPTYKELLYIED